MEREQVARKIKRANEYVDGHLWFDFSETAEGIEEVEIYVEENQIGKVINGQLVLFEDFHPLRFEFDRDNCSVHVMA